MEVDILAITQTKKKGTICTQLKNGHIILPSGVSSNERAKGRVGCNLAKGLKRYECISERIITVELQIKARDIINLLILYGSNEDDLTKNKEYMMFPK